MMQQIAKQMAVAIITSSKPSPRTIRWILIQRMRSG